MKNQPEHTIDESILVKMLSGEMTDAEERTFDRWINEAPENKDYFDDMEKIWSRSGNISVFQSSDAAQAWLDVKQRMRFTGSKREVPEDEKRNGRVFLGIAATIIILLGIGIVTKKYVITSPEMLIAATGEMKEEVMLPDGSRVFLNKHSEIVYPEKFGRKQREIEFRGEGYFEIERDPDKTFQISIGNSAVVKVLGTTFNIKSDLEHKSVSVRVVNGTVAFFPLDDESERVILSKDEGALLRNGVISGKLSEDKNYLSWKTGVLYFEDESLENVLIELEKYYNREFILKEDFRDNEIRFTSIIDNQDLESVLDEMNLVLSLEYEFLDGKVIISVSD